MNSTYDFVYTAFKDFLFSLTPRFDFFVISWVACSGSHLQRSILYCFFYLFICFSSQPVLQLIDIILLRRLNDIPDRKERQIRVQINGNVINAYCYPPCSTRLTEQKLQINKKRQTALVKDLNSEEYLLKLKIKKNS